MTTVEDSPLLRLLRDALARRLRQDGRNASRIDPDSDLIELGLVDSQGLLDMILDAEEGSGQMFDAEGMDFETGVTLRRLAAAFGAPA
ncbi:MAG TPA: phosphopantetheine-binding protein [Acetobacteraceae bacterium]|nr:phosphopantetheine-binding protein [Acetobacteraceae bacterium]